MLESVPIQSLGHTLWLTRAFRLILLLMGCLVRFKEPEINQMVHNTGISFSRAGFLNEKMEVQLKILKGGKFQGGTFLLDTTSDDGYVKAEGCYS